jgi:2-polyprenyl-3-methyl-5-hydroxy-6-metoxy-1,4-benzoquinol methylase
MESQVLQASDESLDNRFQFGENWSRFLRVLNEERDLQAEGGLQQLLRCDRLDDKTFLDVGSGSGLMSLAARRLGAKVFSFDFDPNSVACTQELRRRHDPNDIDWQVTQGSVLDRAFLSSIPPHDIVYSWGVLHHTGRMWEALENVAPLVAPSGQLFIAIYNDQGGASRRWKSFKQWYIASPSAIQTVLAAFVVVRCWTITCIRDLQHLTPFRTWKTYSRVRGMSPWHDAVDWAGGYPFEVATPEAIFEFYRERGFELENLKTVGGGIGCNQFVFRRRA